MLLTYLGSFFFHQHAKFTHFASIMFSIDYHHMTFFPSHSFEQYYQGVRRCWRFGQKHPVHVDVITTEGEAGVTANLHRKAEAADKMFQRLVDEMNSATRKNIVTVFGNKMEVPSWL